MTQKTPEEFNLSDKRNPAVKGYYYLDKDVKEFIRLLREKLLDRAYSCGCCFDDDENHKYIKEEIDKLAGEDLVK